MLIAGLRARLKDPDVSNRGLAAWALGEVGSAADRTPPRALVEAETEARSRGCYRNAPATAPAR